QGLSAVAAPSLGDPARFDIALRPAAAADAARLFVPPEQNTAPEPARWASDPMRLEAERELVARIGAHLSERLPDYMKPSSFQVLDVMPLTSTGKLDRGALPEPVGTRQHTYIAPRHSDEELMAEVWAQVLGVERVGMADDFFSLGGHSLLATEVVARAREALGVDIPLALIFESPTVAQLCAAIRDRAEAAPGKPAEVPLTRLPRTSARSGRA
ncbi:phosphopantetheine-binding protein, partial [Streptomyces sp. W16]|uniref:phosphopantetheine-binding protein n=1 Tax=Streptomyces sp. W16 TaxID=3076631 RepID=UPI00295BBA8D